MTVENQTAADLLLNIPAVRQLAEANDFYANAQYAGIDLGALAHDRESSMTALTSGEQKRLASAIQHYQPQLNALGVNNIMAALRVQLMDYYMQNPAVIDIDGIETPLPITWTEFKKMSLKPEQYQKALIAYYQNPYHTALRYISKPNHWMAGNASYVYVDDEDPSYKWSTFEEYQSLIAMFWLAAVDDDKAMAPCDGQTMEGRISNFIQELALVGRAHNWDDKRPVLDKQGNPVLDENGIQVLEEYDNLQGDKPSCYSGVKRRLFQSVIGHPLIDILDIDKINQELKFFLLREWRQRITDDNRKSLKEIYDSYVSTLELSDIGIEEYKKLNITPEQKDHFIADLKTKYGDQLDKELLSYIEKQFFIEEDNCDPSLAYHFVKLGGLAGGDYLLLPSKPDSSLRSSRNRFFSPEHPDDAKLNDVLEVDSKNSKNLG
ncbi:hypothetical protein EP47_12425 [Legionella norrlandica]|uniref:Uncharacterized protein n=1 Tax=Legionella norrlandica TaxID=1498499 RepID=A0A0A2SWN1_9GAMM|nr:hypothetical protein [Legionella norrlandica]KGP63829.1 hypothetical protein EP47_12425 [Legionella norrlandica]